MMLGFIHQVMEVLIIREILLGITSMILADTHQVHHFHRILLPQIHILLRHPYHHRHHLPRIHLPLNLLQHLHLNHYLVFLYLSKIITQWVMTQVTLGVVANRTIMKQSWKSKEKKKKWIIDCSRSASKQNQINLLRYNSSKPKLCHQISCKKEKWDSFDIELTFSFYYYDCFCWVIKFFCLSRILYRVLYEIVHVIKQANKIFMEGNGE